MKVVCILEQCTYKPGDQPPEGYLAWHEWAEVQRKAGIKQVQCGKCGLWKTPQELSAEVIEYEAKTRQGKPVTVREPVCNKCASRLTTNMITDQQHELLKIGQRTNIAWDVPHKDTYRGTVVATDRLGVVVDFDREPGAGLKKRQRFTRRKDGRFIAARWHWVVGVPVLVAETSN